MSSGTTIHEYFKAGVGSGGIREAEIEMEKTVFRMFCEYMSMCVCVCTYILRVCVCMCVTLACVRKYAFGVLFNGIVLILENYTVF